MNQQHPPEPTAEHFFFFSKHPDLVKALNEILDQIQQSPLRIKHNSSRHQSNQNSLSFEETVCRMSMATTMYLMTIRKQDTFKPVHRAYVRHRFPEDWVHMCPDACREIILMHINSLHPLLLKRNQNFVTASPSTSSKTSIHVTEKISQYAIIWMQTYGPAGARFEFLERCVNCCTKMFSRFQDTQEFLSLSSFDNGYQNVIELLIKNTKFEPLNGALNDAFIAFYNSAQREIYEAQMASDDEESTATCTTNFATASVGAHIQQEGSDGNNDSDSGMSTTSNKKVDTCLIAMSEPIRNENDIGQIHEENNELNFLEQNRRDNDSDSCISTSNKIVDTCKTDMSQQSNNENDIDQSHHDKNNELNSMEQSTISSNVQQSVNEDPMDKTSVHTQMSCPPPYILL
jgi:hypothetical protein